MTPYEMAQEFHTQFEPHPPEKVQAFDLQSARFRAGFKVEELVEFLYATASDEENFFASVEKLHQSIDSAKAKILAKEEPVTDVLIGQVDALTDLLYFTYGSFALMKIDPQPIFEIVHRANMGKIFPDGSAHYHEVTHKVLKPDNWQNDFAPEPLIEKEIQQQKEQ